MTRLVKRRPAGEDHAVDDCLAHRCIEHPEHTDVPAMNGNGPDGSECALCVGEALVRAYEKAFEKSIFWPLIETARNRMNMMSFGAGDRFQDEARATLNAGKMLSEHDAAAEEKPNGK